MTVTPDDFDAATASVLTALATATDRDWTQAPGTGDWNARVTAEHIGDGLMSYAAQLAVRPTTGYVRFLAQVDADATAADVVEFAAAGAGMLSASLRVADPDLLAYHPSGMADPAAFAGMGCVEVLVHGVDIARGLGSALEPPRDVCARVVAAMFPRLDVAGLDPWTALLWATNRVEVPGRPSQRGWRWRG
ncbi:maleylpyruvate isomerase family mycothiol-dependent enzyme [Actinokineospora inagensis]|uniref:maleylpyruvate isomerase family mycothiol-dependent enzyme n=1 Tax=Actinokineospora inagensis TaxID=103730 RepID=UPI0003F62C41|nr:maleylpyruvate isomerase family mycothiol-dependent enzyme [Actinokineospora inagensis]